MFKKLTTTVHEGTQREKIGVFGGEISFPVL
jgi:hypothetical protein